MRTFVSILYVLAMSSFSFADTITTKEGKAFEGIVTAFDKNGKLTLSTGYGDLVFNVQSDIKDATISVYVWPASATAKQPDRSQEFTTWAKDRAAAMPKPKAMWGDVPAAKQRDEADFSSVMGDLFELIKGGDSGDDSKSIKERKEFRKKLQSRTNGKWIYIALKVEYVSEIDGVIVAQLGSEIFDARSGSTCQVRFSGVDTLTASAQDQAEIDEKNLNRKSGTLFIKKSVAEELKRGDSIIIKANLIIPDEGRESWILVPIFWRRAK